MQPHFTAALRAPGRRLQVFTASAWLDALLAYCETGLMSVDANRRTAQRNAGMRSRVHAFRQRLGSRPLPDPPRQAGETHVDAPLAAGRSDTGRPPGESAPSTPMLEESRNLRAASTGEVAVIVTGRPNT
jgi:hypothetical protein